jgi:hypothetical protein
METLTSLMTRFCAGEDSWLARSNNSTSDPGTSEARNSNDRPRRNKNKRRSNTGNAEDKTVNAGFSGPNSSQRKKPFKRNKNGSSSLDRILNRPCQIHGTPDKPANHTNRSCWVFKQAGKLNTEHKGKESPNEDDDEDPRPPNTGGQKKFPHEVKTLNMIYVTHIPKREHKRTLRYVYAIDPIAPKFNPRSACPITFDRRDHPTSILHGGSAALVLDPIIDGFHLMRVLMDGGSSINLLYQDTVRKMGIDSSRIKPAKTTFKGIIPGVEARYTSSITLEGVFGSPDNFRSEDLIFGIVPFRCGYHALLTQTAFTRFNMVPHYAYLKLKMPGPRGVITVHGNMDRSLCTEEHIAALAAEVQVSLIKPNSIAAVKPPDPVKRVRTTLQNDSPARQELH